MSITATTRHLKSVAVAQLPHTNKYAPPFYLFSTENARATATMKVVYIGVSLPPHRRLRRPSLTSAPQIFNNEAKPAVELTHESDLSSYGRFTRGSIAEFVRTPPPPRPERLTSSTASTATHAYKDPSS